MKKILLLYMFLFLVLCVVDTTQTAQNISTKVLRFHVIANSDSNDDQDEKLRLKSYIVEKLRPIMQSFDNVNDAKKWVNNHQQIIENLCYSYLKNLVK
ncbi:hypothetical protein P261_00788 [Lachnospiraceae bacterium TWA4]|nr:hypothetical protein P261_00788 [Lachnospiraceae bacterium TWA4]